jgi:hypothetical protein
VPREPRKRITRRDGETAPWGEREGLFFEGRIEPDLEEMAERPTGESEGQSGGDHPFMSTASKFAKCVQRQVRKLCGALLCKGEI